MKTRILALSLVLVFFAYGKSDIVSAKQSKVIELTATDEGLKIATIHLDDQSLLFESNHSAETFLFTADAFYIINHKDKTYRVQSFDELQVALRQKLSEIGGPLAPLPTGPDTDIKLTEETDTIAGLKARKLIETSNSKQTNVIWVSSDLVPSGLRVAGEKMRMMLPTDYWNKIRGHPGIPEIILLYGIPLKLVSDGRTVYQAKVIEATDSGFSMQVPAGYRKVAK